MNGNWGRPTRSSSVVLAPWAATPPGTLIVAFGAGLAVREEDEAALLVLTFGRSDMSGPEAEGGALPAVFRGSRLATGVEERAKALVFAGEEERVAFVDGM